MKLLSDKDALETIYGKISIGFLIVQDVIAILILIAISSLSAGGNTLNEFLFTFLKGAAAVSGLFMVSLLVLPRVMKFFARSQEFLFLFSVAWVLMLSSLFLYLNLSLEIGALLAGIALSLSPYSSEISSKLKPMRDFFVVMFFIVIGSQMLIQDVKLNLIPIIVFSSFILIGNPLIVMIIMGAMGYTKRNGFLAGLTVAQISEFSIILIALGISVGHLSQEVLSLITFVGLITIAGSTYMISYSEKLYGFLSPYLSIFESKKIKEKKEIKKEYSAILFGYNRIGFNILRALKSIRKSYLVVDFDPDVIDNLTKLKIPAVYGDAFDEELLQELPLKKTKIVISTIPDCETNLLLIETIKKINPNIIIIVRAHQISEAMELYKEGATYVLTPHFLGGEYVAKMIRELKTNDKEYKTEKDKHIEMLKEIEKKGHKHPHVERD